jgi:hypothetical protein
VLAYDRAQFRLYRAIGHAPHLPARSTPINPEASVTPVPAPNVGVTPIPAPNAAANLIPSRYADPLRR